MASPTEHVWSVMRGDVRTVEPIDRLDLANVVMKLAGIRHLPVVSEGALAGVISIGDVVRWRVQEISAEAEALRTYVTQG